MPTPPEQSELHPELARWIAARGWRPFEFQRETWRALSAGRSGLLHATTGSGKTYAVWLGILNRALQGEKAGEPRPERVSSLPRLRARKAQAAAPLQVLWITPMRALAADSVRALKAPLEAIDLDWSVGARTGDTPAAERARQSKRLPTALVTTPESLSLLLTRADVRDIFSTLTHVVVDELHELMGSKRGTQTLLALARLARWRPDLAVWGLSATLRNVEEAAAALTGSALPPAVLVQGLEPKELIIDTLIPPRIERFSWGGHLGTQLLDAVAEQIGRTGTTLIFTNTRSQAEIWFLALLEARPEWAGLLALHHGSIDRKERDWVELALKEGRLKAVVCTSSLDLGVDFLPVERVLQIGSAKGVARLMQRAGRSGHAPGRAARVTLVPTNALELIEAAAARQAALARQVEPRTPPEKPLDVLVQHLVTVALGGGFTPDALFEEVRTAYPYRNLNREEFDWCLAFVERGGVSLAAYPEYHRVVRDEGGVYHVPRKDIAKRHRMSIGTITSDAMMNVAWLGGKKIGTMEEGFIARLRPGDCFTFAGRVLELIRVREMTAYVRKAPRSRGALPRWDGSRMALTSELAQASLAILERAHRGDFAEPELAAIRPLLALQQRWSALPRSGVLVCESVRSREGHHFYCYPFAGRLVHMGLGSLIAHRAARSSPGTFSLSMNDYGFELVAAQRFPWRELIEHGLFSTENLMQDVLESLDMSRLPQRKFREIARVAGLIFQGFPGAPKSARQLQASSGLIYEVFRKHDRANLLLTQAESEALGQELELHRLREALERMSRWQLAFCEPPRFTPFSFALMVERLRSKVSNEKLADRVQRLLAELERAADASAPVKRIAEAGA
jgi:ATP-dependent Lhr-like helicase